MEKYTSFAQYQYAQPWEKRQELMTHNALAYGAGGLLVLFWGLIALVAFGPVPILILFVVLIHVAPLFWVRDRVRFYLNNRKANQQ